MKRKNKGLVICSSSAAENGFTLMELLITLAIISLLVGLLLPALSAVRKAAKEAKQQAQLTTIELAISAFKNDYGDYPPSDQFSHDTGKNDYCGAQKLAEALLGWDLLGFHPKSTWSADGRDTAGNPVYSSTDPNLRQRKGPYLELATTNAFRLGTSAAGIRDGLFDVPSSSPLYPSRDRYVICDVFGIKAVKVGNKIVKAGTPILYYRANTSSKTMVNDLTKFDSNIYNILDNESLVSLGRVTDGSIYHPLVNSDIFYSADNGVLDPKIAIPWPYRPDSYILISAGADGLYGTPDDIRNFGY